MIFRHRLGRTRICGTVEGNSSVVHPGSPVVSHHERRTVRLSAAASTAVLGVALLLAGCDNDGTGVEDAGGGDNHVDTAMSSSLGQAAPQPTEGTDVPHPTEGAGAAGQPESGQPAQPTTATVAFGNYTVPMGENTLLCTFAENPGAEGYAWACEAPAHLGWGATDGGEANAVAYRPGGDPEVYAVLGNSGISASGALAAGAENSVGGRYTVDTTAADTVVVTDTTTGVAVRLGADGYAQL